jgi:hypothetical protein
VRPSRPAAFTATLHVPPDDRINLLNIQQAIKTLQAHLAVCVIWEQCYVYLNHKTLIIFGLTINKKQSSRATNGLVKQGHDCT